MENLLERKQTINTPSSNVDTIPTPGGIQDLFDSAGM
jgi:hypothetical protein